MSLKAAKLGLWRHDRDFADSRTSDPGSSPAFLHGSQPFELHIPDRAQAYAFIADTLRGLGYGRLKRPDKRLVRRYLVKVTGCSRQQLTHLIAQYRAQGRLQDQRHQPSPGPLPSATPQPIRCLAELDALHGTFSGPATRKLCARSYRMFGDTRFERLATIANGHLYKLRDAA